MRRLVAVALCVALGGVSVAHAQSSSPSVSPERLALAKQLIESTGGKDRAVEMVKTIMATLTAGLQKNMPLAQARLYAQVQSKLQEEMVSLVPALVDVSEQVYAKTLTEQELRDELSWLQSASGRSIRDKTSLILQQIAQAEVPLLQAMMPRMTERVIDEVCSQTQCTEQDRRVAAAALAKTMGAPAS